MKKIIIMLPFTLLLTGCMRNEGFQSNWPARITRYWIGAEYWANRLQDWQLSNERLECINGHEPLRTIHLLTHESAAGDGELTVSIDLGRITPTAEANRQCFAGLLIGAGDIQTDYKRRSLIHNQPVSDGGIIAAITGKGSLVLMDNSTDSSMPAILCCDTIHQHKIDKNKIRLTVKVTTKSGFSSLTFTAFDLTNKTKIDELELIELPDSMVTGNIALITHGGADAEGNSYWFSSWTASGKKLRSHPQRAFGPVLGAQYTLSNNILKLTAQFPPIGDDEPRNVFLECSKKGSGQYKLLGKAIISSPGWLATFRIENWDSRKDYDYRLIYYVRDDINNKVQYTYKGIIRHDPVEKQEIIMTAFTDNNNGFLKNLWFPHEDICKQVEQVNPDLLFFSGDQVYEGRPVSADFSSIQNTMLDYLYKWYMWCWAYASITSTRPCITIPDDHDVYHGNLWGCGGKAAPAFPENKKYPGHYKGNEDYWQQDQGGYKLPPDLVNLIQRTQCSHLPDPYDRTPVEQGIEVYYTSLHLGRISFAILEDRKFKSAPSVEFPEANIVNGFSTSEFNPKKLSKPELQLLGERQLRFIREWTADWTATDMKVALMQSVFACLQTVNSSTIKNQVGSHLPSTIAAGEMLAADMDANGWPIQGRNAALRELRKGFIFMIGGDQHLASIIHHGIDEWDDAGWSFCVPSISNLFPRHWMPPDTGLMHNDSLPSYTGRYHDAFGNKINVWAVANPCSTGVHPAKLHDKAPGFGVVRLNKKTQTITMECWPRYADITKDKQYPGWPKTILMTDNYSRTPVAWLPVIICEGLQRPPVIQIVNEKDNSVVYTLRMAEMKFKPPVFEYAAYTIIIGEPGTESIKRFSSVMALRADDNKEIHFNF